MSEPLTYAAAGVDVDAGEEAVRRMHRAVESTHGAQVLGGIGGFAGLWRLAAGRHRDPVLASSADGVGTKLLVARALGVHDTVGIDLVAMVVDDLVVTGAEPLFLLDYLAVGKVDPDQVAAVVAGVAEGCRHARCALLGGETAEHPDAMEVGAYDLAGFGVGIAEREALLGPERVRDGDVLIACASSGMHANGFSLARRALAQAGLGYERHVEELGTTLGAALLTPSRIYAPDIVDLLVGTDGVHALCHVTGGGLPGNLPRSLPGGLRPRIDWRSWEPPAIFSVVQQAGRVAGEEMARATNLGVGMVLVVSPAAADGVASFLRGRGHGTWVLGEVGR